MPRSNVRSSNDPATFVRMAFKAMPTVDIRIRLLLLLIPDIYFQLISSGFHINET